MYAETTRRKKNEEKSECLIETMFSKLSHEREGKREILIDFIGVRHSL